VDRAAHSVSYIQEQLAPICNLIDTKFPRRILCFLEKYNGWPFDAFWIGLLVFGNCGTFYHQLHILGAPCPYYSKEVDGWNVRFLQVSILKTLEHPNIINLVEVIDDQKSDYMYMGMDSLFHMFWSMFFKNLTRTIVLMHFYLSFGTWLLSSSSWIRGKQLYEQHFGDERTDWWNNCKKIFQGCNCRPHLFASPRKLPISWSRFPL
jgi:hypothetical protein